MRRLLLASLVVLAACTSSSPGGRLRSGPSPLTFGVEGFSVSWTSREAAQAALVVRDAANDRVLWQSLPGQAFLSAAKGSEKVKESRGSFHLDDMLSEQCHDQAVDALSGTADVLQVSGRLFCDHGEVPYTIEFTAASPTQLRFAVTVQDPSYNRLYLIGASDSDEHFFGFGEQYTYFDLKGTRVPILVQEQGIGRGAFPVTLGANLTAGAGGDFSSTYAAVPFYVTSRARSLFLENTGYSAFDLRSPDRVTVEAHTSQLVGRILSGETPLALIESYTTYAGRMRRLPDWILSGAVIGMQGGTAKVREVRQKLESHGTPLAAFWLQDWVGQRVTSFGKQLWWNWELDSDQYPEWTQLVAELKQGNLRVMTYVNPFFVDVADVKPNARRNLFEEAKTAGHLVKTATGESYLIPNTSFSAGLLDLSSPEARAWMKDVLKQEVLGAGASGWMADFGEALPWDARLSSGEAPVFHNAYPEAWAQLNREAIEEAGVGDDVVFFSRSGFTRSPGQSTLFWLGDQLVSWDEYDGLKSAVTGLLSGGVSGFSLNHSDIGGYTTIDNPLQNYHRSPELLKRWSEFAAFTVVFRTHEGNKPDANQQVYSDEESLTHFSRMAKVYQAWQFYRRQLVDEAAETGHPVARHLFLHYPADPEVYRLRWEEFLVGTELLVAPVTDPSVTRVRVYLPAGEWIHVWTGETLGNAEGGRWVTVDAPLGQPAVFYKSGSAVGETFRQNLQAAGLL